MCISRGHLNICNTAFHTICRIHTGTHFISFSLEIERIKGNNDSGDDDDNGGDDGDDDDEGDIKEEEKEK